MFFRIILATGLAVFSFVATSGHVHAAANTSLSIAVTPMQCTIEIINDGTTQVSRLIPEGCNQSKPAHELAVSIQRSLVTDNQNQPPAHQNSRSAFGPATLMGIFMLTVPLPKRS